MNTLTCVTYNILRTNTKANLYKIAYILLQLNPDVIALQEVPEKFYEYLRGNHYFTDNYAFRRPPTLDAPTYPDGEMLLIKKKFKPIFYEPYLLPATRQHRFLVSAEILLPNMKTIMIGCVHIESIFKSKRDTVVKGNQIVEASELLMGTHTDGVILMGDMNLTGGEYLEQENEFILNSGLTDVLPYLHPEMIEDSNNPIYATWDSLNNKLVKNSDIHRPDRCLFSSSENTLEPIVIERIVNSYSDHYGLYVIFEINSTYKN